MAGTFLRMQGISKSFPGVKALRKVGFEVDRGEIVALLGENGAGKSTLMKILTGVYQADEGSIELGGQTVQFRGTRQAYENGIAIVFQEFNLCPNLSAMENLFLGYELTNAWGAISYDRMRKKAVEAFDRLGLHIDPDVPVRNLGVAQQQMVEVAKALSHETRILIMDEPTSALADAEIERLFKLMKSLAAQGLAIVFISHKLKEVLRISDRVVCLRDGRNSGKALTRDCTEDKLVSMMVGRELEAMYSARGGGATEEVVLEVRGVSGPPRIRDVSFVLRRGEIVGLAGLIGAGRTELALLLMGAVRMKSGTVLLHGKEFLIRSPSDAVTGNIAYVSEDRKQLGLVTRMTVRENITMAIHGRIANSIGLIDSRKENAVSRMYIQRLGIKVAGSEQVVKNLSGGNQQKVCIAKWLAIEPEILILDEPTRGIDVAAKAEIHRLISELADNGVAVLVISSELIELLHLADRILVMHEGRLTADIPREDADEETVMKAAVAG